MEFEEDEKAKSGLLRCGETKLRFFWTVASMNLTTCVVFYGLALVNWKLFVKRIQVRFEVVLKYCHFILKLGSTFLSHNFEHPCLCGKFKIVINVSLSYSL